MLITARNGCPCFKKTEGEQAKQDSKAGFSCLPVFSIPEKKKRGFGVLENSVSHVWEMCLNLESVGSIFLPDSGFATFWIFTFGFHVVC